MHSYNPCLLLFLYPSCLFVDCSANRILACQCRFVCQLSLAVCLNCVNSSERGTRRILVRRTESVLRVRPESCALCGGERADYNNQDTLAQRERPTIECSCVSCRLRIRSSAPFSGSFHWLLGCFLCPVAPRSEREVRTEKERQEQAALPTAAYPHCLHWSSSSSPRFSSFLYRLQGTRTCTHRNLAPPTAHRWLVLN